MASENKNEKILVSVFMLAFNHGRFVSQAIESALSQKTNFRYEVLIHDDASTDDTKNIILDYEKKYREVIKCIIQKDNQWSKHEPILHKYLFPIAKGKYFIILEGDDYWINNNILQKAVDYLENYPQIAAYGMKHLTVDSKNNVLSISHINMPTNCVYDFDMTSKYLTRVCHTATIMKRTNLINTEKYKKGQEKCCLVGGHTFGLLYCASAGGIYISDEIGGTWRCVVEKGGDSYSSRSADNPVYYSKKLFEQSKEYKRFFKNKGKLTHFVIQSAFTSICISLKSDLSINEKLKLVKSVYEVLSSKERKKLLLYTIMEIIRKILRNQLAIVEKSL